MHRTIVATIALAAVSTLPSCAPVQPVLPPLVPQAVVGAGCHEPPPSTAARWDVAFRYAGQYRIDQIGLGFSAWVAERAGWHETVRMEHPSPAVMEWRNPVDGSAHKASALFGASIPPTVCGRYV